MNNVQQFVSQGGVGASAAYLLVACPTVWWEALPPVPEGHFLPIVAALGAVITAAVRLGAGKPIEPPKEEEKIK